MTTSEAKKKEILQDKVHRNLEVNAQRNGETLTTLMSEFENINDYVVPVGTFDDCNLWFHSNGSVKMGVKDLEELAGGLLRL